MTVFTGKRVTGKIRAMGVEAYLTRISSSASRATVNRDAIRTTILSGGISYRACWVW